MEARPEGIFLGEEKVCSVVLVSALLNCVDFVWENFLHSARKIAWMETVFREIRVTKERKLSAPVSWNGSYSLFHVHPLSQIPGYVVHSDLMVWCHLEMAHVVYLQTLKLQALSLQCLNCVMLC